MDYHSLKASLQLQPSTWVVGAVACGVTYWLYGVFRDRKLPPGPRRLPLLGNLVEIMRQPDAAYVYFRKIAHRYGPMMTIHAGPFPVVVINDMEGMRQTLIKHQDEFAGRAMTLTILLTSEGGKDIAFGDFGPAWSLHRRLAMTAIKQYAGSQDALSRLVNECATEVCQVMVEKKEAFEPKSTVYLIVYNMLAQLCFGKHFSQDDEDFQWLIKMVQDFNTTLGVGLVGDYIPALAFVPTPTKRKILKMVDDIIEYMEKYIQEHLNTFDENNIRDILDAVIQAQRQFEREGVEDMSLFTEIHRRETIMDIFFAGTDTTAFTVYWLILAMMTYPSLQDEIHVEIDSSVGRSKVITYKDRVRLPRTECIIYEVMRYRPIAPLSIPHRVTKTVEINGYTIPENMTVLPNLYSCHFDPKCWKDPDKFDPSRFVGSDGKVMPKPDGFVPFSAGRRQCAGEHVARADIFLTFTNIMQKLRFLPDPQRKEPYTMDFATDAGPFQCVPPEYKILVEMR